MYSREDEEGKTIFAKKWEALDLENACSLFILLSMF